MKQQPETEFNNTLNNKHFTSRLNIISGRRFSRFRKSPNFITLFFILLLLLVVPITTNISQRAMQIRLKAAATSSLVFNPQTITLVSGGENKDVSLLINSGLSEVSFIHVEIGFDKNKIQLAGNPQVNVVSFQKIIKVTDINSANQTGIIEIALGVDPGISGPTGTFEIVKLPFTAVTLETNITSYIKITDTNVLITDVLANPLSLSLPTPSVTVYINPLNSPFPTPSASLQPTPTSTPAPSSTVDVQPPTAELFYPLDNTVVVRNSQVSIKAHATDNIAVVKVEFRVNNKLVCSITQISDYTCDWQVPAKPTTLYTIEAKAFDAAGNTATHSVKVTSSK